MRIPKIVRQKGPSVQAEVLKQKSPAKAYIRARSLDSNLQKAEAFVREWGVKNGNREVVQSASRMARHFERHWRSVQATVQEKVRTREYMVTLLQHDGCPANAIRVYRSMVRFLAERGSLDSFHHLPRWEIVRRSHLSSTKVAYCLDLLSYVGALERKGGRSRTIDWEGMQATAYLAPAVEQVKPAPPVLPHTVDKARQLLARGEWRWTALREKVGLDAKGFAGLLETLASEVQVEPIPTKGRNRRVIRYVRH